jgi:hypothetical protein
MMMPPDATGHCHAQASERLCSAAASGGSDVLFILQAMQQNKWAITNQ